MNNLNFGNARYQYYETICSGSPAGPGFPGTDAVHTHMTNTRLTDPEVLEFRYPVVLEDFHIRKGSGGRGQMERRRRRPPHHPLPRKDGMHDPVRPPPRAAVRPGRRRSRSGRRELGAPQRRPDGEAEGLRRHRDRRRRGGHHPDADRGRVSGSRFLRQNEMAGTMPGHRVTEDCACDCGVTSAGSPTGASCRRAPA